MRHEVRHRTAALAECIHHFKSKRMSRNYGKYGRLQVQQLKSHDHHALLNARVVGRPPAVQSRSCLLLRLMQQASYVAVITTSDNLCAVLLAY